MKLKHMHKYGFYFCLLILLPLVSPGSQKAEDLFLKGNEDYAKAKYEAAIIAYQKILDDGYESASVYFNMGNANYKLDNIPSAILSYEKALKLSPGDDDIRINLQLANLKITDKVDAVPQFFLVTWWYNFLLWFSVSEWSAIGITLITLGFLLLVVYLFSETLVVKKSAFYIGLCLSIAGVFSIVVSGLQEAHFNNNAGAIIFAGTVNVKSAPRADQKTLFVIHEGTKVIIKARDKDWVQAELANGNIGWIQSADLKEI